MADVAPPYEEVQRGLLDPNLRFHASTYREYYRNRNISFAKLLVTMIAEFVQETNPPLLAPAYSRGCYYDKNGNLEWDEEVGYPAFEVFETGQAKHVLDLVKQDLNRRGFVVRKLRLTNAQDGCTESPLTCKCKGHGIFIQWDLTWYDTPTAGAARNLQ